MFQILNYLIAKMSLSGLYYLIRLKVKIFIFYKLFELTWYLQEIKSNVWPDNNWLKIYLSYRYQL